MLPSFANNIHILWNIFFIALTNFLQREKNSVIIQAYANNKRSIYYDKSKYEMRHKII